jgi:hydroxyquinol 1,2-dioxygenase
MRNLSEKNLTDVVLARLARCEDPRFKQIMTGLIRHVHDFVREVELTEAEWFEAIQFLTATGQKCDADRQEFILLSDVLGVSMLVDAINHRKPNGATESTVLGPFYVAGAPDLPAGADIAHGSPGEPAEVSGQVRALDGKPIAGAVLDIWQTAANGFYSTQDPDQDRFNLRGRFRTDAKGGFSFRTIKPVSYPVPTDGPVGRILGAMGRHPHRPAHIHFIVSAEGYDGVATHLFAEGDPYLDSDVVFGVKNSLVVPFTPSADGKRLEVRYEFRLTPAASAGGKK